MVKLTELPFDILHGICWELSPFRNHGTVPPLIDWKRDVFSKPLSPLVHLCRSCSTLRHVAQPVIYRFPYTSDSKLASLVGTLATRKDLALQVRCLMIGTPVCEGRDPREHQDISSEDLELFNSMIEMHSKPTTGDPIRISPNWSQRRENGSRDKQDIGLFRQQPECALVALLLTQVPNILGLLIHSKVHSFPFCQLGSLPRLAELHVLLPNCRHSLEGIQNVLAAAPALEKLDTDLGYLASHKVFHCNLTTINLGCYVLTARAFKSLLHASKRLERLSYVRSPTSGFRQATLPEVLDAILLRADTLRSLVLWFNQDDGRQSIDVSMMEKLKDMKSLENLRIFLDGVYHPADLRLDNILPPSIRSFNNDYPRLCSSNQERASAVMALAKSVPGKFPNLKEVIFHIWEEESGEEEGEEGEAEDIDNEIHVAFEKHGITCYLHPFSL